ncbi:hypothetical protein SAMN05216238_109179 [Lentibacillus persicus]|uniref:Uncharacterized protein n=1 Tax=Lentibacillus persicus TaxID=640948 RepID=A0A1I1YLM5_9BACI|nr:hypothetical protein [Lentibacillus persicus]SFE18900.1 hypothetical protein SAMN05216238_109179 [Lentibacillus persicus]
MTTKILSKLGAPILALSLVTACGGTAEEQTPVENETPINQEEYNGIDIEPTENEMNDDFGKELDEDMHMEDDIPENHLEKDEETESED